MNSPEIQNSEDINRVIAIGWECLVDVFYYCGAIDINPYGKITWNEAKTRDLKVVTPILKAVPELAFAKSKAALLRSGYLAFSEKQKSCINSGKFTPIYNPDLNILVLHFNVRRLSPYPINPKNPNLLLQEAKHCFLQPYVDHAELVEHVHCALALMGVAYQVIRFASRCYLCPAQSELGSKYCINHKQTYRFEAGRTRSQALRNYHVGIKARKLAIAQGIKRFAAAGSDLTHEEAICEVAERLLPSPAFLSKANRHAQIILELKRSPLVTEKLGGSHVSNLDYPALESLIHQRLIPAQIYNLNLARAIRDFEAWLQLEQRAASEKTKSTQGLQEKVQRAVDMANSGKKASEIAKELQVVPSTISNWKNKYPILRAAFKADVSV